MNRLLLTAALAGLFHSTACMAGKRLPQPDLVEDAAAFATTDREKAARLLEDAATHEEVSKSELPVVFLHAGEQRRLLGEADTAHAHFRKAEGGDKSVRAAARLGLALLDAYDGLDSRVVGLLEEPNDKEVLATQNADRYLFLAKHAAETDDKKKLREYSRKALVYSRDDADVNARIGKALVKLEDTPEGVAADELVDPDGNTTADGTLLDRADAALDAGNDGKARKLAEQAAASTDTGEAQAGEYYLRMLDAGAVNSKLVGVLLPLSGKYEIAGKQVRDALEMGYGTAARKLVFVDSGGTAESAVAALESLVFEERVVAVVGPLLTVESEPIRDAAEAMRVPLVSLSQAIEVEEDSRFLVQGQVTANAQVAALLDHVVGKQDLQSFAIFAPDNNYGRNASEAFQAQAEARGAKVTVVEYYDAEATDLIPFASKLGRKDYEARAREFRELKKLAEEQGGNPSRVVLPPELDFQALFVPDNHKRVPIACAALAYEEFPIGDFQAEKDGVTIPLLGLSGWNHPDLVTRGGLYTRGSFFVDSFWRAEPDEDSFVREYRSETGRSPSQLEANAYDIGMLLKAAAGSNATTRGAFLDALKASEIEGGVSGLTGVDESGAAKRTFRVLTINEERIVEVPDPTDDGSDDGE